jgi:Tfp pilus assembly protein PilV
MIALTLLAVGLLTLAAMQIQALSGGRSGHLDTYATTLAQDQMEELNQLSWTSIPPTGGWTAPVTVTHPSNGQSYLVSWQIADAVPNWTRTVDVRVNWSTPKRPNRSRTLSSIRYNREGA